MTSIQILSVILALICLFVTFIVGMKTSLLHEKDKTTRFSFSKTQMWLWTMIILPAFVLNWGFSIDLIPGINNVSLILLGISAGTLTTSDIIKATQEASRENAKLAHLYQGDRKLKMDDVQGGRFWVDILTDDGGNFSIGRLQNLLFTLVYLVIYSVMFFHDGMEYPELENQAFVLMGISSGSYLLARSNFK